MGSSSILLSALLATPCLSQWTYTGDTTATWEQAVARYQDLDRLHSGAGLVEFGHDDDGSPLHLFLIADGSGFTPDSIRAAGKNILWITNGIHPGEPDGVDASLMLAQALLESDQLMGLMAHTAVCIVPMYNVSGAERRGAFSRANQNGPLEYGFRGNARNLDLNRDFIKADAENSRSMQRGLAQWDPDVYFETHVSDGADHQYVMELLTTQKDKLDGGLSAFMTRTMVPRLYEWMKSKNMLMCPYFETEGDTPEEGLVGFYDSPRYSTGYNALFDRIGILAESHMLKPYADRVNATFQLMLATLAAMNEHAEELRNTRAAARKNTASMNELGMNWVLDTTRVERLPWKGWAADQKPSDVSGLPRLYYDHTRPTETTVPWKEKHRPSIIKAKPFGYIIPQAWSDIAGRLKAQGVKVETLDGERTFTAEVDSIAEFKTGQQPYEGHYVHREVHCVRKRAKHTAMPGDFLIRTGQFTDRLIMETLEPEGEDSYFAWGFFDSALQQKEWFSDYVFEDIAADLLRKDPALRVALEAERAANPAFAKDAWAQLYFVYQRSPYFEPSFRKYPVLRVIGE
jgi:murein tripeptide amidase MpaA